MNRVQRREWRTEVFGHSRLTPAQKLVLLALETYADYPEGTNARPGVVALASRCGLGMRVVDNALQQGRALELIEQTGRANPKRGLAAVYRLVSIRTSVQIEDDSTRTSVRVEKEFSPHDGADGTPVLSAQTEFQSAREDVSTRTSVRATNPLTPIHNTEEPTRAQGDVEAIAGELIGETTQTPLNRKAFLQLRSQVVDLLNEGLDEELIREALVRLDGRPDAGPGLLPFLYSDVVKERHQMESAGREFEHSADIRRAIDNCTHCDDYGRALANIAADCPFHPNFLERTAHA